MIQHIDGTNAIQMSIEGNKIRVDCFIDGGCVYSALHPATVIANILEGVGQ